MRSREREAESVGKGIDIKSIKNQGFVCAASL